MKKLDIGVLVSSGAKRTLESLIFFLRENGFELAEIIEIDSREKQENFSKSFIFGLKKIVVKQLRFAKRLLRAAWSLASFQHKLTIKEIAEMFRAAGKDVPEHVLLDKLPLPPVRNYRKISAMSVNDSCVVELLKNSKSKHFCFLSDELAKAPLFSTGKHFLLVHPGEIPRFRGRDPIIWSMLKTKTWTWSAIYLNQGVDTGDLIATHSEEVPRLSLPKNCKLTSANLNMLLRFVQGIYNVRLRKMQLLAKVCIMIHESGYKYLGEKLPEVPLGENNRQYYLAAKEVNLLAMRTLFPRK